MPNDVFRLKIYKSWAGRSNQGNWVNDYEIVTGLAIDAPDWNDIISRFRHFEANLHLQPVNFMRAVLSTVRQDKQIYPRNLRVFPLAGNGGRPIPQGSSALPLDIALSIQKQILFGRSGRLLLRGALHTGNLAIAAGGVPTLAPDTLAQGDLVNAMSQINQAIAAGTFRWVVLHSGVNLQDDQYDEVRNVIGASYGNVVISKRDHRYFDRGEAAAA